MDEMKREKLEAIIGGTRRLPTLPGVAVKILDAVNKEHVALKELGDILAMDPPLSAEVLKVINSPLFGAKVKVSSVPHAVNLLGLDAVKNLALGFALIRNYRNGDKAYFDYTRFWKNSLMGAVACKLIAGKTIPPLAEHAFCLGLLQDMGILAFTECIPEQYNLVVEEKDRNACSYIEAENQILGLNHAELGEYLLTSWGLPESLTLPLRHHHAPEGMGGDGGNTDILAKIVHLSSIYVDFCTSPNKGVHLGLLEHFITEYGFMNYLKVEELAREIHDQAATLFPIFQINVDDEQAYADVLKAAREELLDFTSELVRKLLEQRRLIENLKRRAAHDGLTDLLNYQSFQELLEKEIYRAKRYKSPLCVILADIDHFKAVNDTYGHPAGDAVLKGVAACMEGTLRQSDVVTRYGGEEFGIIMPETAMKDAFVVTERLRRTLEALKIEYEGETISVTLSFGIASMDSEDVGKEDLVRSADASLYEAKRNGRNQVCISQTKAAA